MQVLLAYPLAEVGRFGQVRQAYEMGAVAVGATIYFGSDNATRQIQEVSAAFSEAHELGMFTVLWCYLRNPQFKQGEVDHHTAADLTAFKPAWHVLHAPELSLLQLLEVIFGILLAWVGANEVPAPSVLTGGVLVIGALVVNEWIGWKQRP